MWNTVFEPQSLLNSSHVIHSLILNSNGHCSSLCWLTAARVNIIRPILPPNATVASLNNYISNIVTYFFLPLSRLRFCCLSNNFLVNQESHECNINIGVLMSACVWVRLKMRECQRTCRHYSGMTDLFFSLLHPSLSAFSPQFLFYLFYLGVLQCTISCSNNKRVCQSFKHDLLQLIGKFQKWYAS